MIEEKTPLEKFHQLDSKLEKEKQQATRKIVSWSIVLIVVMALSVYEQMFLALLFGFIFLIGVLIYLPGILLMNMQRAISKLLKKEKKEEQDLAKIKKEYEAISVLTFEHIPKELVPTAWYLLSEKGTPAETLAAREKKFEEMNIQLQVYISSNERNFWEYFKSWKWLKKLPKEG
ncbi:MAG: hypothetical protein NTY80_02295 [candidate division SR1 bacterium]|nr:hypothetical protein [candidate division SR1 bacterium]